jgi:hypothetical protein
MVCVAQSAYVHLRTYMHLRTDTHMHMHTRTYAGCDGEQEEWVHIHVAPAPSPPVEETPDLGASRDWKIIFDVYRDEYKRNESALLASVGKDARSSRLRPVLLYISIYKNI